MIARRYALVLYRHEDQRLSLDALAERAAMHPALVQRYVECGLIEPSDWEGATSVFDPSAVARLRMVGRLRNTLSINIAGIEVILNLLERFQALQRENERLRAVQRSNFEVQT
jgi:DNA-binding transcriptional MerR regulator